MKSVAQVQAPDRATNQLQSNILTVLNLLNKNSLLSGNFISQVTISPSTDISAATTINHGLNHPLTGWFAIRKRSTSDIWDLQDQNPNPALTLILNTNLTVVLDLYVF